MKVLMISTDRKVFERNSAVRQRVISYGNLVEELHMIVLSKVNDKSRSSQLIAHSLRQRISGSNVTLYPTNSRNKFFYIFDAIRIGRKIIKDSHQSFRNSKFETRNSSDFLITTQDPFETGFAGWFIAKTTKSKLQLQIHTDFMSAGFQLNSFLNSIRVKLALFLVPQADGIRVVSERIKQSLKTKNLKLKTEPKILPIFVDIKKFENEVSSFDLHKKYPQFDFIILTVARLEKEKRFDLALKILAEVVASDSKTGLIIVGDGSLKERLEKKAKLLGIQGNIIFEGWKDNLISYYKTADLFMFTSNYEGYGLALIESASSGCPIITTDVGVVGSILKKGDVRICQAGNKKCFVEGILDLKKDGLALYDMSIKARKRVEEVIIKDKQEYLRQMKQGWEECLKS